MLVPELRRALDAGGGLRTLFAWMSPGEARVLETAELESAKSWVAEVAS